MMYHPISLTYQSECIGLGHPSPLVSRLLCATLHIRFPSPQEISATRMSGDNGMALLVYRTVNERERERGGGGGGGGGGEKAHRTTHVKCFKVCVNLGDDCLPALVVTPRRARRFGGRRGG